MHTEEERREWKNKWKEHAAMRVLTAVIVIVFVFWAGFEFGEIHAYAVQYGGGWGMMQGGWGNSYYGQ